jgi:hypothetical protein
MRMVARVLALALVVTSGCTDPDPALCTDGVKRVGVDEPLAALDGDTPEERFARAAKPWSCSVTWFALPESIAVQEPVPGTSALTLSLERTSDQARYREYAQTPGEKWERAGCQQDAVFVPCRLALSSEDGALDETLECELRLQGDNTYVYIVLPDYDFTGEHGTTFVEGIEPNGVELGITYTLGADPVRVDGSIIEAGARERGVDPILTTAAIECSAL